MTSTRSRSKPEPAVDSPPAIESADVPEIGLPLVEERVQETGAFSVVQWLLDVGVLPYRRYEAWRHGELPDLETALAQDRDALQAHLAALESHARALELVNTPETFYHWQPEWAEHALTLSRDSTLAERLAQRWARPERTPQLDLFMDSGASVAERALQHALAGHNPDAAENARSRLCGLAPNHPGLGDYESLILYSRHIAEHPDVEGAEVADELAGLDEEIAPIARSVLGERARDYLVPAWRRLAHALPRERFDPHHPRLHASYAWARIPEPDGIRDSVTAVADYASHTPLLIRLALALDHQRRNADALLVWARCYEHDPEAAREAIEQSGPGRLRQRLRAFDDLDVGSAAEDFPAWLLLQAPSLASHDGDERGLPTPTGAAFATVRTLLRAHASGADEMPSRAWLKAHAPALLELYLQRR